MAWDGGHARKLRRLKRMTQTQLAEVIGVARVTIHYWEAGTTAPNAGHMKRLREVLGAGHLDLHSDGGGPDLRDLRRAAGLTQVQAAERMRVSSSSIRRWEHGKHPLPDPYELWVDTYGVPVEVIEAAAKRSLRQS